MKNKLKSKLFQKSILLIVVLSIVVRFGYMFLQETPPVEVTKVTTKTVKLELPKAVYNLQTTSTATITATKDTVKLSCSDCLLAPVDKIHYLTSTYAPSVVSHNLSGGGQLTSAAASALGGLFKDAKKDGITMGVISAYRSYATQTTTFNGWVSVEMAKGYNRATAEARANTYSAKPGHSEHQLGTTADIGCPGCGFEKSTKNLAVWKWLDKHAVDYGFVQSYPSGREDDTGYVAEAWHYRYIGIDNAKAYKAQSAKTLNQWLLSRY